LLASRDRSRLARQHQERSLERILRRVPVSEHALADTQDHFSVPLDQGCERSLRGFATAGGKSLEQLDIAELTGRAAMEKGVKLPQDVP
jgi:hypothetical protein